MDSFTSTSESTHVTASINAEELYAQHAIMEDIALNPDQLDHIPVPNPVPQVPAVMAPAFDPYNFLTDDEIAEQIAQLQQFEGRKRAREEDDVDNGPRKRQRTSVQHDEAHNTVEDTNSQNDITTDVNQMEMIGQDMPNPVTNNDIVLHPEQDTAAESLKCSRELKPQ